MFPYSIPAEVSSVFQAQSKQSDSHALRDTLRIVEFHKDLQGFRATISGHGQIYERQGITMASMSFSQGFSMCPGCFLLCPGWSMLSLGTRVTLELLIFRRFSKVSRKPSVRPEKISRGLLFYCRFFEYSGDLSFLAGMQYMASESCVLGMLYKT